MTRRFRRTTHDETPAPPQVVRAAIARAVLGQRRTAQAGATLDAAMGDVTLLPHQRDAVQRLRPVLRDTRVALLADDVGLGKTFVALAVAREYAHVRIIAPAALLPMWREAVARTNCTNATIESLHRFSRTLPPHESAPHRALVIIDEAHHLRAPSTKRYRAVSELVAGRDLLLMSATPVHNSAGDLRALLALAMGERANTLTAELLARVVVRRTHPGSPPGSPPGSHVTGTPRTVERPSITLPHDPAILDRILALPAPLPAHDGAVAGALIRLGLLRAWCSSDAALAHALRQRILRGEALKQALDAGRHPTSAELRSWLVGEHEVQLAFPELLAGHVTAEGTLRDVLGKHLNAVRELLSDHHLLSRADLARSAGMRAILEAHPHMPVVAFSQYATTVRSIGRALADIAGVGVLSGRRATIASGTISRREALAHFAPVAQGRPPPPVHQRIRLLITTDLLSEGVNLQDAGVIVHLDLPWTDAARRQREGRLTRVGSPHATVTVYRFAPPDGAERVLRMHERVERKARLSRTLIGSTQGHRAIARSAADAATMTREMLASWSANDGADLHANPVWCGFEAAAGAFVAAISVPDSGSILLAGRRITDAEGRVQTRMTTSPRRALRLLRTCQRANPIDAGSSRARDAWRHAARAIRHWIARRALISDVGDTDQARSSAHRRAHRALSHVMAAASPTERVLQRRAFQDAFAAIDRARGVAAERALDSWTAGCGAIPVERWLQHWRSWPVLASSGRHAFPATAAPRVPPSPVVVAAFVFVPVDNATAR